MTPISPRRLRPGMQERCSPICAESIVWHVLIALNRAEPIQQLAQQYGQPNRTCKEEMDATDALPLSSRRMDLLDRSMGGIVRLTGSRQMRGNAVVASNPHEAPESRD